MLVLSANHLEKGKVDNNDFHFVNLSYSEIVLFCLANVFQKNFQFLLKY